uniref:Uncharacterized protein n=1 Tax=Geospiza parvula TaxID=87175 RepID=A0A8C3QE14_GEOPR
EHPAGEGVSRSVAMASRCQKCGQQVPRNLPFTAVRITEGEMKSYHDFIGGCVRLERMAKKDTEFSVCVMSSAWKILLKNKCKELKQ